MVRNYSRKISNSASQNWDVAQDPNDWMYFANNNGLLEYDGSSWMIYPIRNYTNVRSVYYDMKSDKIYVGAFNEFGYYERNTFGKLVYHSLIDLLEKENRNFTEIWNITQSGNIIYFQGDNVLFRYEDNQLTRFDFDDKVYSSAVVHNTFMLSNHKDGILIMNGDLFIRLPGSDVLKGKRICAILPYNEKMVLFVTDFHGMYVYNGEKVEHLDTDIDDFMMKNQVFCAAVNNSQLAIGTVRNGLVVKDLKNNINVFSNTFTGLQNNTILSMTFDRLGNLWLGLDKGIDHVLINSPVYDLFGNSIVYGSGYSSVVAYNRLYLGTNQGLYFTSIPMKGSPSVQTIYPVNEIRGQIWKLAKIDNTIFCASDPGVFIITDSKITKIKEVVSGAWGFREISGYKNKYILGSSYNGFFILEKKGDKWMFKNHIKGFTEGGGAFEIDEKQRIWFSHWMKGVFRMTLNSQLDSIVKLEQIDKKFGLPTTRNNSLHKIDNKIVFSTEGGFYEFNKNNEKIESSVFLKGLFGPQYFSSKLFKSSNGDIWNVSNTKIVRAIKKKEKFYIDDMSYNLLKNKLIPGFEHINYLNSHYMIIGTEDGFSIIDNENIQISTDTVLKVTIKNVYITGKRDSLVAGFLPGLRPVMKLGADQNSIRFEYQATEYRNENVIKYACFLDNYDSDWSAYTTVNTKEYTKLRKGTYNFMVKAINEYNSVIAETNFKFVILPAWYETTLALIAYGLILIGILIWLAIILKRHSEKGAQRMKIQKEKEMKAQEERFQIQARDKEKEIIELKNQQLQYELRHKSQDLANTTMNLIRKNEILLDIKQDISKISEEIDDKKFNERLVKVLNRIQNDIRKNIEHDNDWHKFQENFDLVYENYLKRLSEQFPSLTVSDKKLCAYLKMDLSSKDIAPLLNMSYRSVEMSRYRLRKKMDLNRDVNLVEFLQKL